MTFSYPQYGTVVLQLQMDVNNGCVTSETGNIVVALLNAQNGNVQILASLEGPSPAFCPIDTSFFATDTAAYLVSFGGPGHKYEPGVWILPYGGAASFVPISNHDFTTNVESFFALL